jgi:transcriptional regulator with XRE-family HTH domain
VRKITIEEFAGLFGAGKSLMTMWMNGERRPGPKYKKRIIERYGSEAIEAFGEDPDQYAVNQAWEYLSPEMRRSLREQAEQNAQKNTERASKNEELQRLNNAWCHLSHIQRKLIRLQSMIAALPQRSLHALDEHIHDARPGWSIIIRPIGYQDENRSTFFFSSKPLSLGSCR